MNKNKKVEIPEYYPIPKGVSKLVEGTFTSCYNKYGESSRCLDFEEDNYNYWRVSLKSNYDSLKRKWNCILQVDNGDDDILQRWEELNKENWRILFTIYEDLLFIDKDLLKDYKIEQK
jgi:hypothetical protein